MSINGNAIRMQPCVGGYCPSNPLDDTKGIDGGTTTPGGVLATPPTETVAAASSSSESWVAVAESSGMNDDENSFESTRPNATIVHESPSTRIYKLPDADNAFGGRTGAVAIKFLADPHPPADRIRALHNEYILSRRRPRQQPLLDGEGITVAGGDGGNGHGSGGGGAGAGAEACVAMRAALKYARHQPSGLHAVYLEWADGVTLGEWIASFVQRDSLVRHHATMSFASASVGDESERKGNGRTRPRCPPPPPLMTLVRLASEIAGAIAALHDVAGIAHLSLAPDNVIVSEVLRANDCARAPEEENGVITARCGRGDNTGGTSSSSDGYRHRRGGSDECDGEAERSQQLVAPSSFSVKLIDLGMAAVLNTRDPVASATSRAADLVSLGAVLSELFRLAEPEPHRNQQKPMDASADDEAEADAEEGMFDGREDLERSRGGRWRGGLPRSISTLLSRLTNDDDGAHPAPPGYRSARDVHGDLLQMLELPGRFLVPAAGLGGDDDGGGGAARHPLPYNDGRLYGRDEEVSRILDAHSRAGGRIGVKDRPGRRCRGGGFGPPPPGVVLISGTSGSGKSSLVRHVRRSLRGGDDPRRPSRPHTFLAGKFDQLRRVEPLSALLAALSVYSERFGDCEHGRHHPNGRAFRGKLGGAIRHAVGPDGCSILVELIPEIRHVLGGHRNNADSNAGADATRPETLPEAPPSVFVPVPVQSPPPPLADVKEAQHRVRFILQTFVTTLAACVASEGGGPLVFFLDDLQWADEASVDLLRGILLTGDDASNADADAGLMGAAASSSLLFIGCYRDTDVEHTQNHPLSGLIRDLEAGNEQQYAVLTKIQLDGITGRAMNDLVADTLCMPRSLTRPLADAIRRKTNGNAFFAVQFLTSLVEDRSFRVCSVDDMERIVAESHAMDDTSGRFIAKKLEILPPEMQIALQMAACLGSHCEEDILCLLTDDDDAECSFVGLPCRDEGENRGTCICSHPERCLTHLLAFAVRLDLMTKSGPRYEFAHDQIQHAAYESIPEDERRALHLRIGKRLWKHSSSSLKHKLVFAAVDQILLGILFVDEVDKIPLAELFLRAGKKAITSSLFSAAAMYLKAGISLLGPGHWDDHYDLSLRLYVAYSESDCLNGRFDTIQDVLADVLAHARCFEDKLRPYSIMVNGLGIMCMVHEAIEICFLVLECLGETLPEPENLAVQIKSEYVSTMNMLDGFTDETLVTMQSMKDDEKIAAMDFLFSLTVYTYTTRPRFCPLVTMRMVKLSLLHGVCRTSAYAFAWYGALSCGMFGRSQRGYQFGQIALQLLTRFDNNEYIARVYAVVYGYTIHWSAPIGLCLEPLLEGQRIGMMFGDVKYAMLNIHQYSICAFHAGRRLVQLEEDLNVFCRIMNKYNLTRILALATVTKQTVQKLMSASDHAVCPTAEYANQAEMVKKFLASKNVYAVCFIHLNWMFLAYHFGDYTLASDIANKTRNVANLDFSMWVCIHAFYDSLTSLALARKTKIDKWRVLAMEAMKKITDWAINSPHNFQNKAALLEAEFAYLQGDRFNAGALYDVSIYTAGKNGFIHEQALACERAGYFYFENGDTSKATEYFDQAHDLYMEWGAMGKAERLRAKSLALAIGDS